MQDNDTAWKFLFNDNPQPMWIMDMDGRTFPFLAVNDAALAAYGHSRDEFLTMSALDIRPAEDHVAFVEMLRGLGLTDSEAGPWRHRRKDGTLFWTESYSHPVEFAGRAARLVTARDVSEREEALRALRESEEKYRLLADSMHDVVALHDIDGKFLFVSPSVAKLTGFTVEETLRQNVGEVTHPEDRARMFAETLWQLSERQTALVEWRRLCKDGSYLWVETRSSLVADDPARRADFFESSSTQVNQFVSGETAALPRSGAAGRQAILMCSSRDITERKNAEEALRQSEALLRRVVTGAPVILYAVDRDGRVTLSEGEGLAALGFSPGQLVGTSIFDLYDALPDIAEDRRRAMEGATFTTVRDVSGLVFETRYSPLRDQSGDRAGFVAVATNITERRQIEDALLQAERDYRTIFENSLDGIFQTTPNGRYLRANPALARLFGYESPDDLIRSLPNVPEQLYLDPQHRARFIGELQEHGVVSGFESQVRRRDGVIL